MRAILLGAACVISAIQVTELHAQQAGRSKAAQEREIAAVRAVVRQVDQAIGANALVADSTTDPCDTGHWYARVRLWTEPTGRVRQLRWEGTTDHHGENRYYYYDALGHLRFVFISRQADNSTSEEKRSYHTADRRLLRETATLLSGPGYSFHKDYPIRDPNGRLRGRC